MRGKGLERSEPKEGGQEKRPPVKAFILRVHKVGRFSFLALVIIPTDGGQGFQSIVDSDSV
jgi:hypothetical protein